ncbi:MAG TPA: ABC transporter permease [Acidimicrobiales bacterium]|nr:ABC transporter permease [Acidimicrobiales bacterium]
MSQLLGYLVAGLATGCIYAITSSGLVLTYTTSGIFNFAHGAVGMVAAFVYWQLLVGYHWPTLVALFVALFIVAPLIGALLEFVVIRRIRHASLGLSVVVTLGLLVFLLGLSATIWPPTEDRRIPEFFAGHSVRLFGTAISDHDLTIVVVAIGLAVGLRLFFRRTRLGIRMRGVVDNAELASILGTSPARVSMISWAMGAWMAALAGILIAPLEFLNEYNLTMIVVSGYAAAVLGRLRNIPLTVAGGLALGIIDALAVGYMPPSLLTPLHPVIPILLLFAVVVALPERRLQQATVLRTARRSPPSLRTSLVTAAFFMVIAWVLSGALSQANLITGGEGLVLGFIMLSLVLLTGYGGQVSLCQVTFAGLGAYAMSKFGHVSTLLGLVTAAGLGAAVGVVVAIPVLRLRGLYLALATLAFAYAMDTLFFVQYFGMGGVVIVHQFHVPGLPAGLRGYFIFLAAAFSIAAVGVLAVRRGPFGRLLAAVNDSPDACTTLGLRLTGVRLVTFGAAAGLAGLGGALYGALQGTAEGGEFAMLNSLIMLLLVTLGGAGAVTGALWAGLTYAVFPFIQSRYLPHLGQLTFLGVGLGVVALSRNPDGFIGQLGSVIDRLRAYRYRDRAAPAPPGQSPRPEAPDDAALPEQVPAGTAG